MLGVRPYFSWTRHWPSLLPFLARLGSSCWSSSSAGALRFPFLLVTGWAAGSSSSSSSDSCSSSMCSSFSLLWVLFGRAPRAPGPRVDVDHSRCSCFTASWCTLACEEGRYVQGSVHRGGPSPFSRHLCGDTANCDCCWLLVFQEFCWLGFSSGFSWEICLVPGKMC